MRVMTQMGMVMNLDKCIGCHTCSVTCKQAWTNRAGVEYAWFNNVETRPGLGYPRRHEDQQTWKGGWTLNRRGRLALKAGGRVRKLLGIFASPVQPKLEDYYEPWTYDYETLVNAPLGDDFPVARPKSLITGEDTKIRWSANWDDNLAGTAETGHLDPIVEQIRRESEDRIRFEFEQTFMFYLPRICEHCLNPSCVASCPSGAMYKRSEDGIVLVDQDRCRGWRQCVTGCPYKKIYFNHKTGKAEKCTFCYPRVEVGNRRSDAGDPPRRVARIVHQVASCCLSYPDEEFLRRLPMLSAAVDGCRPAPRREVCGRSCITRQPRRWGFSSESMSTCSTYRASTRSTCRTGPTATRVAAARCWGVSSSATAPAVSSSTPTASCPTSCPSCSSTPPSPTRSTVRCCCRSTAPASSCCGSR
jgi:Fe-S-cluster-containing dehydrogenase component